MVKHGCEKKRDGIGQLGEEMLGKGRESQRTAENRREPQRHAEEKRRATMHSNGIGVNSVALPCDGIARNRFAYRRTGQERIWWE